MPLAYEDAWEFLGRVWLCSGYLFTDFLSTRHAPEVTRCISICFDDLTAEAATRLMHDLDLPLRPGMNLAQVREVLGEPISERSNLPGRVSHEFHVGDCPNTAALRENRRQLGADAPSQC